MMCMAGVRVKSKKVPNDPHHVSVVHWVLTAFVAFFVVYGLAAFQRDVYFAVRSGNGRQNDAAQIAQDQNSASASSGGKVSDIQMFYVAEGDNGQSGNKIGCGDSIVAVPTSIEPTRSPLTAAVMMSLADRRATIGDSGLVNILAQSNLSLDSISIDKGTATVKIIGTVQIGGVCDEQRFVSQIENTVLQFPTVTTANIFINDKPLESFLSEK